MIVDYNENSAAGVVKLMKFSSNSGKYEECDNVFKLNELNAIYSRGSVRIPWVKDSWNHGYSITVPVQLYAHASTQYEYLPMGDTFWSFSMDSDNGVLNARINGGTASTTMSTWTDNGDGTFQCLQQNAPHPYVTLSNISYDGLIGAFIPKNIEKN